MARSDPLARIEDIERLDEVAVRLVRQYSVLGIPSAVIRRYGADSTRVMAEHMDARATELLEHGKRAVMRYQRGECEAKRK